MSQHSVFEPFGVLLDPLKSTGEQVLNFIGQHLNPKTRVFDWKAFKDDIDDYEEADMMFDKYKTLTLDQQLTKVSDLTPKIAGFFKDTLPIQKSTRELEVIIDGALLDWKDKKNKGFADFSIEKPKPDDPSAQGSSRPSGGLLKFPWGGDNKPKLKPINSSYTYRLVFQIKNPRIESDFYSLVSTVKIIADIEKEQDWWNLESTTEKNFGVDITAMELVVTQGFKTPNA